MTPFTPHQRDQLLQLAAAVRSSAVDMDRWMYPGGKGETLKCSVVGSVGACWASLHPEAYDFKYFLSQGIVEVFPVEDPYAEIMEYMPRHMGITEEQFDLLVRAPTTQYVIETIERIIREATE